MTGETKTGAKINTLIILFLFGSPVGRYLLETTMMTCTLIESCDGEDRLLQFEPYRWRPCGVTWDSSRTVVVIKLRRTSVEDASVAGLASGAG